MSDAAPLLQLQGVIKNFPGVQALRGIDFDLLPGEIHALLGENGAGKSTLIKVLTGVHPADGGSILIGGVPVKPQNPTDVVRHGISTVYQEVNLAPNLSVAENICLGREPRNAFGIDWQAVGDRAKNALERVGLCVDEQRLLGDVSIAQQQLVAIARALDVEARVLVLDEPTSSLDQDEVAQLFATMRRLRDEGIGIIFVTHFLDQVYEVSDRITVLRNGDLVGTYRTSELPRIELVSHMIGRSAETLEHAAALPHSEVADPPFLQLKEYGRRGSVEGLSFEIKPGEVVGLAGLLGSGRTESVRLLFGIDSGTSGSYLLDGRPAHLSPRTAIGRGIGLNVEDRKAEGIFPGLSIRENMMIVAQVKRRWWRRIGKSEQRRIADRFVQSLQLQPPDIERDIEHLSGGNQQKALLARWLAVEPRLLLLDEPTRGIDIGAKFEIMALVERLRVEGKSFVFISSELSEIIRASTRIVVLRDRRAVATIPRGEANEEAIVQAIAQHE